MTASTANFFLCSVDSFFFVAKFCSSCFLLIYQSLIAIIQTPLLLTVLFVRFLLILFEHRLEQFSPVLLLPKMPYCYIFHPLVSLQLLFVNPQPTIVYSQLRLTSTIFLTVPLPTFSDREQ